jgi:hypothetical protein
MAVRDAFRYARVEGPGREIIFRQHAPANPNAEGGVFWVSARCKSSRSGCLLLVPQRGRLTAAELISGRGCSLPWRDRRRDMSPRRDLRCQFGTSCDPSIRTVLPISARTAGVHPTRLEPVEHDPCGRTMGSRLVA